MSLDKFLPNPMHLKETEKIVNKSKNPILILEKNKILCAVKNPSQRSFQSWFYNVFLGRIYKNNPDRKEIKTNWLIQLTPNEIRLLRKKTCDVIQLTKKR